MSDWNDLVESLRGIEYQRGLVTESSGRYRIDFEPGLSDAEITRTERSFGFRFPPDLRELLQTALPRGNGFPDWRSGDERELRSWLEQPLEDIVFDVQHNDVWLRAWGPRPQTNEQAERRIAELVRDAPTLIPVYGHRMIPDVPQRGNPVFSVHQTDVIVYGANLEDYLRREFMRSSSSELQRAQRIPFWGDIALSN